MEPTIRIATEQDWDAISQLNHNTFALELGQHDVNEDGRKIDRLHNTNLYIVAYMGDELAGMLSITLPLSAPFSTLKRLSFISVEIQNGLHKTAEIRLLAIKPEYRGQGVFDYLMQAVIMECYQRGIEKVLISAIANRVSLYKFMGFIELGEPVQEGSAMYVPMMITQRSLETSPYMRKLAEMARVPEAI